MLLDLLLQIKLSHLVNVKIFQRPFFYEICPQICQPGLWPIFLRDMQEKNINVRNHIHTRACLQEIIINRLLCTSVAKQLIIGLIIMSGRPTYTAQQKHESTLRHTYVLK